MWDKIKGFFSNPIVQFIGPGGIFAVITWLWTNAAQLPLWAIWLAVIFSIGCAFWLVNQIATWSERNKKGLSKYSDKELEQRKISDRSFKIWNDDGTLYAEMLDGILVKKPGDFLKE